MISIEDHILVSSPLQAVFRFAARPENMPLWNPAVLDSRVLDRLRRGALVEQHLEVLGRRFEVLFQVTDFEPFRRVRYTSMRGPIDVEGTMEFEHVPRGTQVRWVVSGDCRKVLRIAEPVLLSLGRYAIHECLQNLKALNEEVELQRLSIPHAGM